ncbi:hypothetical protein EES43_07990 [Streptomyces sp. ADI96-02]|nr:hypothetical protein EES43_07990 [Streptomyces sp. ADI96-02]
MADVPPPPGRETCVSRPAASNFVFQPSVDSSPFVSVLCVLFPNASNVYSAFVFSAVPDCLGVRVSDAGRPDGVYARSVVNGLVLCPELTCLPRASNSFSVTAPGVPSP